jgi:drug/metabolite transporter (DMT)-like permease
MSEASAPDRETTSRSGVWLTELLLVLMATIWGVNFSIVKFATGAMHPLAFNAVRVSLAALALLLIVRVAGHAWPDRKTTFRLALLGVLGNGLYQVLFVEGVAHTRASDASLIMAASPAFIGVIGHLRGVDRLTRRGAIGIVLSIIGIALVVLAGSRAAQGTATIFGGALVLGAAMCWSIYAVMLQPYTKTVDALPLAGITMAGGIPFLVVVATPAMVGTQWSEVPLAAWGAMAYSGILALVVAYLCWNRGVRVVGPTRTAMFANLQPAIALVVAWATLGEQPNRWQLIGAAAIFSGLLLSRRGEKVA